ncbi:MAG: hypothetical protein DWQ04_01815 [Chloroflexi bacterium]|nr:MAG: hypothetical protein DWQ04_01815 [Chloroflexota bacterium]
MDTLTTTDLDLRTHSQILHTEIAVLRRTLIEVNAWPEAGDMLLDLMPLSRWDSLPVSESDFSWLPKVVEHALSGKDIGEQYPAIFQKLLTNDKLRQTFLSQLVIKKDGNILLQ